MAAPPEAKQQQADGSRDTPRTASPGLQLPARMRWSRAIVMSTPPTVSVVIPFYNRRGKVGACLDSVLSQVLPGGASLEVIAVDNNSTDGTAEELARFPVRVVHCAVPGPAAARNAEIGRASCRVRV